jgi:hypothetical protein
MNNYWNLSEAQKRVVLEQAATKVGLPVESVEKDLWVTAVLECVFSLPYANKFVFKGGTSLSKVWNCIERFSEDIDLAVDRSQFGLEGDLTVRQIKKLRKEASLFVKDQVTADLKDELKSSGLSKWCEIESEEDGEGDKTYPEPRKIFVRYTPLVPITVGYVKPEVMLEIGSRSLLEPFEYRKVDSLVIRATGMETSTGTVNIPTAVPEKTFLEKAFLLHELFSTDAGTRVDRKSRHLYDLERMMDCDFAKSAITNDDLWNTIHHHRDVFTHMKDVDYTQDIRDRIILIPPANIRTVWETDYEAMRNTMIYGESLPFEKLLKRMEELQEHFRNR